MGGGVLISPMIDAAGIDRRYDEESPNLRSCSVQEQGRALARPVTVRFRRRGAVHDCGNDAGRQEGEGSEQTNVPFALGLALGDLGEGGDTAEPDVVDPSPGLGNCGEQSITAFGPPSRPQPRSCMS